jgi:hypothetical protein
MSTITSTFLVILNKEKDYLLSAALPPGLHLTWSEELLFRKNTKTAALCLHVNILIKHSIAL